MASPIEVRHACGPSFIFLAGHAERRVKILATKREIAHGVWFDGIDLWFRMAHHKKDRA
jgi:hypothetical protein